MTAPSVWVVVRRIRDLSDELVGWAFLETDARDHARHLNAGDEWGPHVAEEIPPLADPLTR